FQSLKCICVQVHQAGKKILKFSFITFEVIKKNFKYLKQIKHLTNSVSTFSAGEQFDPESKSKWDEDWDKNKSSFPFSEKLGEISDKIGSTIDDTINKFRKKERDDSPDRISDNEEDRVSQNGRPAKSEFKDDEETVTTKNVQITQTTDAITSTTTSTRKRGGVPSKTVDLGAAAHYTGSKSSPDADNNQVKYCLHPNSSSMYSCGNSDLIGDFADFSSPAASVSLPSAAGSLSTGNGEFGDWNAFSSTSPPAVTAPSAIPDLFSDVSTSTHPPSADLFDLMTPNNSSLSASQSLTFNMCPQNATTPLSRSQVNQMGLQKSGGKVSMPATWSDPSVNISLDFLSAGLNPSKPTQPTLNTMMQQGVQPPLNTVAQNFAGMTLNGQPLAAAPRPGVNPMMAGGTMGMGMPPTMATGTMGMGSVGIGGMPINQGLVGMNMMPAGIGLQGALGTPSMGIGQGMNPAMVQPKQDAFANFGNFGK
uniref:Clathrin interactor 1 n=2 Tax=Sinocyclocheilus grahami TaxID=75366 RepID=A0A672RG72_SINGR